MPREVFSLMQHDTREPLELQFTLEQRGVEVSDWPGMNCEDADDEVRFYMRPSGWADLVQRIPPPTGLTAIPEPGKGELPAGTYYYRVAPMRNQEEAAPSIEQAIVLPADGRILLGWSSPPSATGYRVYRGTTPGGPYMSFLADVARFTDTGLTIGTPAMPIGPKTAANGEWIDKATGKARYEWADQDVDTPGNFDGQMEATFPDGSSATAPNDGYLLICVLPDLG